MYKRKRAGNTITRKINSTKDTAAKADKNHYISNSYLEGFIPIDTEYFTASFLKIYESNEAGAQGPYNEFSLSLDKSAVNISKETISSAIGSKSG